MSERLTTELFVEKGIKIHGDRYSYEKVVYIKNNINVNIFCKRHGYFSIRPSNFLSGRGCTYCGKEKPQNENKRRNMEAIRRNNAYYFLYNYCILRVAGKFIFLDFEKYDTIKNYNWAISKNGYVVTRKKNKTLYLHKMILKSNTQVDHINRNKLDDRLANLRQATHQQNQLNKSKQKNNTTGFKGVTLLRNGLYKAQIQNNYKRESQIFTNVEDAFNWYVNKAKELHKEFSPEDYYK